MRSDIRAVHVIPSVAEAASGPSYSVVRLCQSLIERGEDVTLVALDSASAAPKPPFLRVFPIGHGPRRLGFSPKMRRWLQTAVLSGELDIVHDHSLWMMPNIYAGSTTRNSKCRLVVAPRGTLSEVALGRSRWVKRVFWSLLQRPALRHAACFHATAEPEYNDIRRAGFRAPVTVVPNGVDVPALERKRVDGHRRLLYLGRIHPIKGVDQLLQAWHAISPRFPEWELHIAGPDNGGYLPRMQALAAELKLQRVEFRGPLYGDEKLRAYREAELFVLPTRSENFGMTVAEALVAGTPAIATHGSPWSGLEEHGAGWWIEVGMDPLVACLEEALSKSPDDMVARGVRGRDWMRQEFSWERVGTMMDDTYRWLICGGETPNFVRLN